MGDSVMKTEDLLQSGCLELERIFTQIKKIADLQKQIARYIDEKIMSYCEVANLTGNKLVLIVANGSIATQIRFQTEELLQHFKNDKLLRNIFSIECKVRPKETPGGKRFNNEDKGSINPLSQESAALVEESARALKDDKLRESMLRIAKHVRK